MYSKKVNADGTVDLLDPAGHRIASTPTERDADVLLPILQAGNNIEIRFMTEEHMWRQGDPEPDDNEVMIGRVYARPGGQQIATITNFDECQNLSNHMARNHPFYQAREAHAQRFRGRTH